MSVLVGKKAPSFTAKAVQGEIIIENFSLDQFIGSREIRFVLAYLEGSGAAKSIPVGQYVSYVPAAGEAGNETYQAQL